MAERAALCSVVSSSTLGSSSRGRLHAASTWSAWACLRALSDLRVPRLLSWSTPVSDGRSSPLRRSAPIEFDRTRSPAITNGLRMLQECIEGGLGIGFVRIGP